MAVDFQPESTSTPACAPSSESADNQRPPRHTSSKYDFVKVKVWLGSQSQPQSQPQSAHYYVLSRFLTAHMLTVTRIPHVVAIKIALQLKKLLVDRGLLDVSQGAMEEELFRLMGRRGYGPEYVQRYRFMTKFYHQRTPLIILVLGTACVGKSTLATQLSQRLNLPNVLQTDVVLELLRSTGLAPLHPLPLWARRFNTDQDLVAEFQRECRLVRRGLEGDMKKALREGKPIIIEGLHLDPASFLGDTTALRSTLLDPLPAVTSLRQDTRADLAGSLQPEASPSRLNSAPREAGEPGSKDDAGQGTGVLNRCEDCQQSTGSMGRAAHAPDSHDPSLGSKEGAKELHVKRGDGAGEAAEQQSSSKKDQGPSTKETTTATSQQPTATETKPQQTEAGTGGTELVEAAGAADEHNKTSEKSTRGSVPLVATGGQGDQSIPLLATAAELEGAGAPIVIPIVLRMGQTDHQMLLQPWLASWQEEMQEIQDALDGESPAQVSANELCRRMMLVQDYLCSWEDKGVLVCDVSILTFSQVLDALHAFVLECIEAKCAHLLSGGKE